MYRAAIDRRNARPETDAFQALTSGIDVRRREREPEPGFDDFTYAMQNEFQELSEADRQLLLSLAKQLNHARRKRDGESE